METQSQQSFGSPSSSPGLRAPNNSPSNGFLPGESLQHHMLSRAFEMPTPSRGEQQNAGAFVRPRQGSTRLRRSAGLPSLRSSRSRSNTQNQVDEMNNAFFPDQSYEPNQENVFNPQSLWRQQHGYGQQHDYDQQRTNSQQSSSRNHITFGAQNNFIPESTIADEHAHLQQRLYSLAQVISTQAGLSPHVVAALTTELRELSQRHIDLRRKCQNEHRLVQSERERFGNLMASQQHLIQNALSERDRACEERDRLQVQFTAMQGTQRDLEQRLEELEKKNAATIDFLSKQIRFKDEQLNGKRSLWMENQNHKTSSSVNKISDTQNPFGTPTTRNMPCTGVGLSRADKSGEMPSTPGPSRSSHLPPSVPFYDSEYDHPNQFWPYHDEHSVNPASRVETGHSPVGESKALIPFKTEDQIAQEFREDFDSTYRLIETWVRNYAHTVNDDMSADQLLSHDEDLWPFMLTCTYPNFAEAHEHTILLLRNPATRSSFVIRLIIQYLYTSVWKATAFGAFNPQYREKLKLIEKQLKVKGLEPSQRANLVAAQTHAVQCVVESKTYLAFRSQALSSHARGLRAKVGPLLDMGVPRAEAGRALGMIAVSAWDLSAKLYTSNYTFLFNFPACGSKFLHPSMECDDPNVEETDLQLHIRQARIKLAIKPIITMRNDRYMTITAKKVQNGHVLIFP